jgi:hypothetical protein
MPRCSCVPLHLSGTQKKSILRVVHQPTAKHEKLLDCHIMHDGCWM